MKSMVKIIAGLSGAALGFALSAGMGLAQVVPSQEAPAQAAPMQELGATALNPVTPGSSGPMTWGNVLSRNFLGSGSAITAPEQTPAAMPLVAEEEGEAITPLAVVELFTSQGCAACPTADAIFERYATATDLVALALHVDYWDYIGWADDFASRDFTRRQKAYAKVAGSKMIYTPQVIVNGAVQLSGNDAAGLQTLVDEARAVESPLSLRMTHHDGKRRLTATVPPGGPELLVQLVRYRPEAAVTIERGENAGKTVTYRNIVTSWELLTRWDGRQPLRLDVGKAGEGHAALVFQRAGPGAMLGGVRLE